MTTCWFNLLDFYAEIDSIKLIGAYCGNNMKSFKYPGVNLDEINFVREPVSIDLSNITGDMKIQTINIFNYYNYIVIKKDNVKSKYKEIFTIKAVSLANNLINNIEMYGFKDPDRIFHKESIPGVLCHLLFFYIFSKENILTTRKVRPIKGNKYKIRRFYTNSSFKYRLDKEYIASRAFLFELLKYDLKEPDKIPKNDKCFKYFSGLLPEASYSYFVRIGFIKFSGIILNTINDLNNYYLSIINDSDSLKRKNIRLSRFLKS